MNFFLSALSYISKTYLAAIYPIIKFSSKKHNFVAISELNYRTKSERNPNSAVPANPKTNKATKRHITKIVEAIPIQPRITPALAKRSPSI
jgi:hypothetical protein